jgi:hypothetical protein
MTQTITLWGCVIVFACAVAMAQKRLSTPPKIASGPSCAGPVTKTGKKGPQAWRSASSSKTTFFGIECRGLTRLFQRMDQYLVGLRAESCRLRMPEHKRERSSPSMNKT